MSFARDMNLVEEVPSGPEKRLTVDALYHAYEDRIYRRTDRLFFLLMVVQWMVGIFFALIISPQAWSGATRSPHPHLYAAIFLGGIFCLFPMILIWRYPGQLITRHAVAIGQVCFSGLLIHLTGGRIESHFHVFGSLAFLACYRDWKVLVTATLIVLVDHLARGMWYPESVYGVVFTTTWRSLEHAGWVIFEDIVLIWSCQVSRREMYNICQQQFQRQEILDGLEIRVRERTRDLECEVAERKRAEGSLRLSEERFRTLVENAPVGIYRTTREGKVEMANPALVEMLQGSATPSVERTAEGYTLCFQGEDRKDYFQRMERDGETKGYESVWRRPDGTTIQVRENARVTRDGNGNLLFYEGTVEDVTDRKRAEEELKELNARLVDTSRLAGMAEVATGVLHNVGNVLNSVNVSSTLIREMLQQSRLSHFSKVVELLRDQKANLVTFLTTDPKGQRLPQFLLHLEGHLVGENQRLLKESACLDQSVQHIRQIVNAQQNFARAFGVVESLDAAQLMEEAIQLNLAGLERHEIKLVRNYSPMPPVQVDRHKVLQILINLLGNAKHALSSVKRSDRQLTLSVVRTDRGHVRWIVTDNGCGIGPENLSKIFRHGFTTKSDGHGFGLHSGALAAQEMDGTLTVNSDGVGTGAAFTLELPAPLQRAAA